MKKNYTKPTLIAKGRVERLTQASNTSNTVIDSSYTAGTPLTSFTFT
ncbi:hypothetical protein HJ526_17345 [Donghicola sp. C2-DW-16]|uniref:RiPP n=1 Tax=Donghicola mangrovi TaxID=2729614 RepID=A0ABX2PI60_9RHOB|nr:hypothetical protein [Donghicola mangrovi]NVO29190.1 hypothetical protein [Donghicola mangrovi]